MSVRLETMPAIDEELRGRLGRHARTPGARGAEGTRRVGWMVAHRPARGAPGPRSDPSRSGDGAAYHRAMLLVVDIGNTNITAGLVRDGSLLTTRRAATRPRVDRRRARAPPRRPAPPRRSRHLPTCSRDRARLGRAGLTAALERAGRAARHARSSSRAPGRCRSPIRVDRPAEVGADRLVNALAAAPPVRNAGRRRRLRDGDDLRLPSRPTGPTSAGRSRRASSSASRRSPTRTARLPRIELRTARPGDRRATPSAPCRPARSSATRPSTAGLLGRIRRELADAAGIAPARRPGDPDRRPVPGRWVRGLEGDRRDRPGPDPQGPGHPPRRGGRRRADRAGLPVSARRPASRRPSSGRLAGRLIAVGVTGSIAAYKAVELAPPPPGRRRRRRRVLLTPSASRFVGPLPLEALTRHPVESDVLALLPDGRIGHIVVADIGRRHRRRPGHGPLAGGDGERPGGRRGDRGLPGDVRPGRRRPGDGRRHVRPPGDPGERRPAARRFGYPIVEPEAGALASGQVGRRTAGRPAPDRRRGRRRGRRPRRSAPRTRRLRPPAVAPRPRGGPRRPARRRDRRRHGRADRPGPLHRQPLDRQDGGGHRRGRPRSGRAGDPDRRPASRCRLPDRATVVRVETAARAPGGPRSRSSAGPTAGPASTRWSWPRRWPTSGRPARPTRSSPAATA